MTGCRTSSPTSTTWAWNTPATPNPAATTRSSSAATSHGGKFIAFWLPHGRLLAGMNVNIWDVTDTIAALIRTGRPINTGRLTDPRTPLEALLEP